MNISTLIGMLLGAVCIVLPILSSSKLVVFASISSILIVLGGSAASLMIGNHFWEIKDAIKALKHILIKPKIKKEELISWAYDMAVVAKREGTIGLERELVLVEDEFLKTGLLFIVDGNKPQQIEKFMEIEISKIEAVQIRNEKFYRLLAELAPAWGMIGTLIGLISMLQALNDPTTIGPKMSIALITTLYGVVLANFIANPIAVKLSKVYEEDMVIKEALTETVLAISREENPREVKERLKLYLSEEF